MSIQENEAIVRRFLDQAYNKRDLSVGDQLLADDCIFHAPPKAFQGINQWKLYATVFLTAFPDELQVTVEDSLAIGDTVAARWTARGTHTGRLRGIAPTGREVRWLGVAFYYFSGGMIKEVWGLNDSLGILQQVDAITLD